MVSILEVRIKNFYSYPADEKQNIKFDKITLIVGPNDAGKTNLFRTLQLLADQPFKPGIPVSEEAILNDPSKEA